MSCFDPEISWAAGLFEGEGTITQSGARLAEEYEALEVLEMLWPWLSARRKGQALDLAPMEAILLEASKNT